MKTLAQKFKSKAAELMPEHYCLQDLDEKINQSNQIDDLMFKQGEYVGGMAQVILKLIK